MANDREGLAADPAIAPETRAVIAGLFGEIERLTADGDRLREELETRAAEIERLRTKKQQTCACMAGPAVWCTVCMRAEAASQQARNLELMRAAVKATEGSGWARVTARVAEVIDRMRDELSKEESGDATERRYA